ncbi:MAG: di-heme oxidoredictase family protein [Vicingaceae bacterium]|nr:thiol oxidoreductase [Flavobacteriales bacterium]MDF1674647.1 di-heme oxidoredictase family protein [Vicingaceae bacterium]
MNKFIVFTICSLTIVACEKTMPFAPEENELLDGPIDGLSVQQQIQFLKGDEAFGDVFTIEEGLGPVFVANQCASCHTGDGKGSPFVKFTRFGQPDTLGNQFLSMGGPQLQHKAIPGYLPEQLPLGATSTDLIAPAVSGLGFLDAVSDADLISLSDPNDANGDGISGRPHWNNIPNYVLFRPNAISQNGRYITRFGKKGGAYDLLHQTSGAYNQDMGITSLFEPIDPFSGLEVDPEVSTQTVHDVVFYLKTLKAPLRRNQDDSDVIIGEQLFSQIACAKCHVPTLRTSYSSIEALSNKVFHPYTDLLLHDMGAGLDDGYTEGFALTSEWKTPALWGLGLSKDAQGGTYFLLHDGRAKSIEEAILLHGGEAQQSKTMYTQLSETEKQQLIKFLESL